MSNLTTSEFRERLKRLRLSVASATRYSRQRERLSRAIGQGTSFESHRPYAPGDDLRYTDWNVYGRLDQFVQKQFSTPGEMNLLLVPDTSPTLNFGWPRRPKLRLLKEVGAALGYLALNASDSVVYAPYLRQGLPARTLSGAGADTVLLKSLDALECAPRDGASVSSWLDQLPAMRGDCLCAILTDFQDQAGIRALIHEFTRRKYRLLVISVIDSAELQPEIEYGFVTLQALSTGEPAALKLRVTPALLEEYRREVEQFRQAAEHACTRHGASRYEVLSDTPMESIIFELARAGFIRARR